jgi:lipoate-protein ligase A
MDAVVVWDEPKSGSDNMSVDEQLLLRATSDWPIVVRIYQWSTPTLSLGHFQDITEREDQPALANLSWVRRKTGGGAIVHDQELTYSIIVPQQNGEVRKGHSELLYRAVHESVADQLRQLGWDAQLAETCTCATAKNEKKDPFLCFLRRTPVDLLVGMHKILGSAQRRSTTGLLQHGSLLIRHSLSTPRLLGLLDLPLRQSDFQDWESYLAANHSLLFSQNRNAQSSFRDRSLQANSTSDPTFPFDVGLWVALLTIGIRQGLDRVFQCHWLNSAPELVLDAFASKPNKVGNWD